ncbi:serine/threonine-protein kinase [Peterkaempfera bronchialis]|uniref:non-specific serine/threonine protein kinase n=1 Tax=Peterkaempfera bronchialis TaxID=2126346 RepID=A0A345T2Z9_9ACTN|nr:serine/threonine-protein kinase [Peterkaempfera bronchialis]AXI80354.1 serine/threonine protein kinase [Peterkaempfera bronchialis]
MLVADRYRLDVAIGRGGMGEVWRAHDEVLGRPVAVKLMLAGDSDEEAAARFRLEAQTAARLHHPQVVTVFDFGAWHDRFYLVMELVEGISLAQELEAHGPLALDRVADVAAQGAAGLAAAHRQGVIHRDIKPGNLMRSTDGTVKIADFGIARFADDASAALTGVGQIVGTSLYLAPERALGRPAGPGSDVYALGCVLYQLLVGEPPFQADTAAGVLHLHVGTEPAPPSWRCPQLPGAFEGYLLRMLAKQPEQRPAAQEVADWFSTPAWRGGAQQAAAPAGAGAATVYALPRSGRQAPAARQAPASGTRRAAPRGRRSSPARRQQSAESLHLRLRAQMRRHKALTIGIAGAVAMAVSALLSMAWFTP